MPTCPSCDATTGESDRFCLNCGRSLQAPTAPAATAVSDPVSEPASPHVELVACPRCGASNAARRRWCGRCGGLLHPEVDVPPAQPLPEVDRVDEHEPTWQPMAAAPPPAPGRRRGVGIAIVVFGLVVGTALGVAAAAGMGPFAAVEPVAFDPSAYPDETSRLRPATTGASSTASPDGARAFEPELTVDGDLATAWAPDGEEEGARLRHGFVAPVWIDRIEVATGDQVDEATFAATARVTEAMVDLGTQRLDVTLAGLDGVQIVRLPEPVLVDEVTWEITGTSGGVGALSEVRYVGWPADEADQRAFHERT